MSDEIYIWETGQGNVGHGSMTLHDGTHISWWPKVDKSKLSVKYHVASAVVDYLKTDTFQVVMKQTKIPIPFLLHQDTHYNALIQIRCIVKFG